jgi:transposase
MTGCRGVCWQDWGVVEWVGWLMAHGFLPVDRDQLFWVSLSYRELVDEDHPVLAVIDAVEQFDLSGFMPDKRPDGKGRAGYHPAMMVALLLWAYCNGVLSSRQIERRCREDAPFRVICAGHEPDHATIARFRADHAEALKGLHVQVLALCAAAGMVRLGLVALDSTKLAGAGSSKASRRYEKVIEQIEAMHAAAAAADAAEEGGQVESPARRSGRRQRQARFTAAKERVEAEAAAAHAAWRARRDKRAAAAARGARPPGRPRSKPDQEPQAAGRRVNTTDPDSSRLFGKQGYVQGYSAHAVVTEDQVVVATRVTNEQNDRPWLHPLIGQAREALDAAGVDAPIGTVVADAGYYSDDNVKGCAEPELLIPPVASDKLHALADDVADRGDEASDTPPAGSKAARRQRMINKLATPAGRAAYSKRQHMVEPVFGDAKHNRGFTRFSRRGLSACDAEFALLAAATNLNKWVRRRKAPGNRPDGPAGGTPSGPDGAASSHGGTAGMTLRRRSTAPRPRPRMRATAPGCYRHRAPSVAATARRH